MTPDPFAEPATDSRGKGHGRGRWVGPFLFSTTWTPEGSPLVQGSRTEADGGSHGGLCFRLWPEATGYYAVVVSKRHALVPNLRATRIRVRRRLDQLVAFPLVRALLRARVSGKCDLCGAPLSGLPYPGWHDEGLALAACRLCAPVEADGYATEPTVALLDDSVIIPAGGAGPEIPDDRRFNFVAPEIDEDWYALGLAASGEPRPRVGELCLRLVELSNPDGPRCHLPLKIPASNLDGAAYCCGIGHRWTATMQRIDPVTGIVGGEPTDGEALPEGRHDRGYPS